jgi:hypothetical protein
MDQHDAPPEAAVKNWLLLETEIKNVLQESNWHITNNLAGDACIFPKENNDRELNITQLARALSPRVLVRITPLPLDPQQANSSNA